MKTQGFYADLPVLDDLFDLANPACYVQAPDDWYVLITDIIGSTDAIADNKYKEVNLIGASSIIAVLNELPPIDIPFVFGGDGASMLVPPDHLQPAREALLGLRSLAYYVFGLDLRMGIVPVSLINQHHPLKVAKFQQSPLYFQASFLGGGITFATELVKRDSTYRLDVMGNPNRVKLDGLECRWQEVPSSRGHTLSLIVTALQSSGEAVSDIYWEVFAKIQSIFGDAEEYHPIATANLNLAFSPQKLNAEVKVRTVSPQSLVRFRYLIRILFENFLGVIFMGLKLTIDGVRWGDYKADVRAASDYQKLDDVLRMVISGTSVQSQQLIQYLEQQSQAGRLAYGLHVSDRALLTCLILDRRNCHFHLVDGADGGYALAAKDLKRQLHQKAQNWKTYTQIARHRKRSTEDTSNPG